MIFSHHHLYKSWNMNLNSIVSEKKRFVKGRKQKARKKSGGALQRRLTAEKSEKTQKFQRKTGKKP
ncbi:MAG: hypothetical protein J6M56_03745 [Clostridia bacterium]|nr:hypothetical protein [Clostridia bacterium]